MLFTLTFIKPLSLQKWWFLIMFIVEVKSFPSLCLTWSKINEWCRRERERELRENKRTKLPKRALCVNIVKNFSAWKITLWRKQSAGKGSVRARRESENEDDEIRHRSTEHIKFRAAEREQFFLFSRATLYRVSASLLAVERWSMALTGGAAMKI